MTIEEFENKWGHLIHSTLMSDLLTDTDKLKKRNKVFVVKRDFEYFGLNRTQVIVIAALNKETATNYIEEKLGGTCDPIWLMNATFDTIYEQNDQNPEKIQAKILYNIVI